MQKAVAALAAMGALALAGPPAPAQAPPRAWGLSPGAAAFLPAYARYAHALQARGVAGLRSVAAPGFTLVSGPQRLTGAAAFAEAGKCLGGLPGDTLTVTVRRVAVTGRTAVAWTREEIASPPKHGTAWRLTWDWRQTWRRAGSGWALASSARDTDAQDTDAPSPLTYTLHPTRR